MAGTYTQDPKSFELEWSATETGKAWIRQPYTVTSDSVIRRCLAFVLQDDYVARIGGFIVCHTRRGQLWVGRVKEILADTFSGKLLGVLVQEYDVGEHIPPYHFPRLQKSANPPVFCQLKVCKLNL